MGTFFILDDFKVKVATLKAIMEHAFLTKLKVNANTFNSCLQFDEEGDDDHPRRRFKVYNKIL